MFILNQCLFWASELEAEIKGKMTRIPGGWQCTECPMNSKYTTSVRNREVNGSFGIIIYLLCIVKNNHSNNVKCAQANLYTHYCSICGISFSTSDKLNRHLKNDHNAMPF